MVHCLRGLADLCLIQQLLWCPLLLLFLRGSELSQSCCCCPQALLASVVLLLKEVPECLWPIWVCQLCLTVVAPCGYPTAAVLLEDLKDVQHCPQHKAKAL